MRKVSNFKLDKIPVWKIVFVVTTSPYYEMHRILLIEDWPNRDEFTLVEGYHQSLCGFDDTKWEAMVYTCNELKRLVIGWGRGPFEIEQKAKPLILQYLENDYDLVAEREMLDR